jgi:hypothetical protein
MANNQPYLRVRRLMLQPWLLVSNNKLLFLVSAFPVVSKKNKPLRVVNSLPKLLVEAVV